MSTVDPETSSKISEAITSKGGSFVEAPVSGSKQPAEAAQLVILAAGDKALYEEVIPALNAMGKKSFFLGQVGNGARMKLVVNMIMGSMMNAFSEGLVLAERSGLNPGDLLDVLDLGAIAAPMFKGKGPNMDMRLALALGDENAVSMPVAAAANEVMLLSSSIFTSSRTCRDLLFTISDCLVCLVIQAFKKARSMGLGDLDFSAVHEVVKMHKD
ncbi:Glyoxylate/succinic semialdehyde reductase 1 [Linum perenne]